MSMSTNIRAQSQSAQNYNRAQRQTIVVVTNPLHQEVLETTNSYERHQNEICIRLIDYNQLTEVVEAVVNTSDVKKIIFLVDNDKDKSLLNSNIKMTYLRNIQMSVWAFPNNKNTGNIIEFLSKISSCSSGVINRIDNLITTNEKEDNIVIPTEKKGLAKIYALIALQQEPVHSLKDALENEYFDRENIWYKNFETWLDKTL